MTVPTGEAEPLEVTSGFDKAIQATKEYLFQPFNAGTWFCVAVCALMEACGEPAGFSGSFDFSKLRNGSRAVLGNGSSVSSSDLALFIPMAVGLMGFLLVVTIALQWVGARGSMMFIRFVSTGDADISRNFHETARPGFDLFKFNVLLLIAISLPGLVGLFSIWMTGGFKFLDGRGEPPWMLLGLVAVLTALAGLCVKIIGTFTRNLVAPLMWKFNLDAFAAWSYFWTEIGSRNIAQLFLFLLIRIALTMGMGIFNLFVVTFTCCVGALPVINQFINAPLYYFERYYSLAVLESLGPAYSPFVKGKADGKAAVSDAPGFPGDPDFVDRNPDQPSDDF